MTVGEVTSEAPGGSSVWGLYEATDPARWSHLAPSAGDVVIVRIPAPISEEEGVYGAFVVVQRILMSDGSLLLRAKSLGATNSAVTTKLSGLFNRRVGHIHCCFGLGECKVEDEVTFHVQTVELQPGSQMELPYVGLAGKRLLRQVRSQVLVEPDDYEAEPFDEEEDLEKEAERMREAAPLNLRGEKLGKGVGDKRAAPSAEVPGEGGRRDLRARLSSLKEKEAEKKRKKEEKELRTEESRPLFQFPPSPPTNAAGMQQGGLQSGTAMHQLSPELMAMLRTANQSGATGVPKGTTSAGLSLSKVNSSVNGQLALRAAAQAQEGGDGGGQPPGGLGPWMQQPKQKKRKKKKKRGKKKKKKHKKNRGGGGPPSGGSSSSSSSSSESSNGSGDSAISSASEYLPPLRRRSERKPGCIMKLLLEQIEEQLAAVQGGGHDNGSLLTGTKVVSYYHLLVRGNGVNSSSRDGRELYLIAVLLDLLRVGSLDRLGDGLSARFLALQQAQIDGHWNAARHFEIFTADISTAAGPALTLEARRHARMMEKARGMEAQRGRGDYGQRPWNQRKGNWNNNASEHTGEVWKGKGKKGKPGKGKGNAWQKSQGRGGAAQESPWGKEPEKGNKEDAK